MNWSRCLCSTRPGNGMLALCQRDHLLHLIGGRHVPAHGIPVQQIQVSVLASGEEIDEFGIKEPTHRSVIQVIVIEELVILRSEVSRHVQGRSDGCELQGAFTAIRRARRINGIPHRSVAVTTYRLPCASAAMPVPLCRCLPRIRRAGIETTRCATSRVYPVSIHDTPPTQWDENVTYTEPLTSVNP